MNLAEYDASFGSLGLWLINLILWLSVQSPSPFFILVGVQYMFDTLRYVGIEYEDCSKELKIEFEVDSWRYEYVLLWLLIKYPDIIG